MPAELPRFVLDTSAILALRGNEGGAARVDRLLRAARAGTATVLASFMTRMELLYRITADEGSAAAHDAVRLLDATGVEWISCDDEILEVAAALKASGGLSVADAWIAATALQRGAVLVHKDPEFALATRAKQQRLPK